MKIHENLLKIKILYKNSIYVNFSIQFLNLRKFFTVFLLTINFTIFFSYQITIPKLNFSSKLRSRPSRPTKPSCRVAHLSLECALREIKKKMANYGGEKQRGSSIAHCSASEPMSRRLSRLVAVCVAILSPLQCPGAVC